MKIEQIKWYLRMFYSDYADIPLTKFLKKFFAGSYINFYFKFRSTSETSLRP